MPDNSGEISRTQYFLQGRFLRLGPIHPILVHAPLILLPATVAFDIAAYVFPHNLFVQSAFWILAVAAGFAILAAIFGVIDFLFEVRGRAEAARTVSWHAGGMSVAVIFALVSLVSRAFDLGSSTVSIASFFLVAVATVIMYAASVFGGHLVYRNGIRVEAAGEEQGELHDLDEVRARRRAG